MHYACTQTHRRRDVRLTAREQEVAHVSNILAKLGLETRVQLAAWTVARGLAAPSPRLSPLYDPGPELL